MTRAHIAEVVAAHPNLRPCVDGSNGGRKTLFDAWRKLRGKLPDALLRQVKRMTDTLKVRESDAKAWAEAYRNNPGKLSEAIDQVLADESLTNRAGVLKFRLFSSGKQAQKPSTAKYTYTQ
jgi:hypothetical protein